MGNSLFLEAVAGLSHNPAAILQRLSCGVFIGAGNVTDNSNSPLAQFGIGRVEIDHMIA